MLAALIGSTGVSYALPPCPNTDFWFPLIVPSQLSGTIGL
jgi:hypothetical protein